MTRCENQQRKANHFCVSLTEINKQTVLAVLVLHQEELQVSLVLFAPLGRWTPTTLWCLRWFASRNVRCSAVNSEIKNNNPQVLIAKKQCFKGLIWKPNLISLLLTPLLWDLPPLSVLRIGWRIAWINLPRQQREYDYRTCHKKLPLLNMERTRMYVVFENCIFEIEDEMPTELLLCTGVKVQDVAGGTCDSINFHQLVTNILQTPKKRFNWSFSALKKITK